MASSPTTESATGRHVEVAVSGMTCAACASGVERTLNRVDGLTANVDYATGKAGHRAAPGERRDDRRDRRARGLRRRDRRALAAGGRTASDDSAGLFHRLIVSVLLFVPVADLSITLTVLPDWRLPGRRWLLLALAAPVIGWAAWPFHRVAWANLRRGAASVDTLVSLGIVAATSWSVYAMFVQATPSPPTGASWKGGARSTPAR